MTEKQIEQAAMDYGESLPHKTYRINPARIIIDSTVIAAEAFEAGATIRQPKIDTLTTEVERWKQDAHKTQTREQITQKLFAEKKQEAANLRQFTEWIPVPRDRSGFVEWDIFRLPPAEAYLCRTDNEDLIPYETTYEFTSESQMNHILAVLPIPLYQTKEGDR